MLLFLIGSTLHVLLFFFYTYWNLAFDRTFKIIFYLEVGQRQLVSAFTHQMGPPGPVNWLLEATSSLLSIIIKIQNLWRK